MLPQFHIINNFISYFINVAQWDDIKNRKKFFERYARDNSFDPLLPDNWYSQKSSDILSSKVLSFS